MKTKQNNSKAFTIIELLTVMSIIVVLIGLLVPALNRVRRYSMDVKQKAQLHSIEAALTLFVSEYDEYPDSRAEDINKDKYCGAMKLCEALMGQDLMGFHPGSRFLLNGTDRAGEYLYAPDVPDLKSNLKERPQGPSLPPENANAYRLRNIYPEITGSTLAAAAEKFVLCDVYKNANSIGDVVKSKIGMPILYYKANPSGAYHEPNLVTSAGDGPTETSNNNFIYNVYDNQDLVALGKPWEDSSSQNKYHALDTTKTFGLDNTSGIEKFYEMTTNSQITIEGVQNQDMSKRPYKPNTFILISAGFDGEYGTADDITNYEN